MRPFIQFSSRNIQKSKEYYLAFHIAEDVFAANFPKIAGFSKEFKFKAYEGNVSYISGFAEINDETVTIVDLNRKIGVKANSCHNSGKLIIVETEVFETKLKFAISYDQLGDAFEIPYNKMMPAPTIGEKYEQGFIKGVHVHDKNCILILDFENLFNIDDLIDIMVEFNKNKI